MFLFTKPWILGYGILGTCTLLTITGLLVIVPAGERAAVFNSFDGVEHRTLTEGCHIMMPFIESPVKYDVRTQTYTMSSSDEEGDKRGNDALTALSLDGQKVHIDVSVRYHLVPEQIWQLHDQIGPHYVEKIIRPEAQTAVRNVVAKYTVTQLSMHDNRFKTK